MDDILSRQAAIEAIHEDADWLAAQGSDWQTERMERDKSILKSLPSAQRERCEDCENFSKTRLLIPQPERKKGKWIEFDSDEDKYDVIKCPCCKHTFTVDSYHWTDIGFIKDDFKFCPNCGADMRGEHEG